MFSAIICTTIVLAAFSGLSSALVIHPSDGSLAQTPAPLINTSFPLDGAPPTALEDGQIQCRGRQFGTDLDYLSCLDAFATFTYGFDPHHVEVGRRGTGTYVHTLPWKWVSGRKVWSFVILEAY